MAQKQNARTRYDNKCKTYAIKYYPAEIAESARLSAYLAQTGQSANAYIKSLIKADLDSKNVPYPPQEPDNDIL